MKSKMLKTLAFIMSAFLLVYAGFQVWRFFYNPYRTEIAVNYSVSESIHVNGLAVRTETIIEDSYSGSVSYVYEDAAKVLKNRPVAYSHASSDTVVKMAKANEIEKQINLLKEASSGVSQLYGSSEYINDQIGTAVLAYTEAITGGKLSGFSSAKDNLLLSINKKTAITGGENRFEERIAALQMEYDELKYEIEADAAETVSAPKSGYFISGVDGFENIINKENIYEKTVAEIEEIINRDVSASEQKIGKIADNYKWYYVVSVDPAGAEMFYEGRKVSVNFEGINYSLDFKVESIITDETSENTIVVLVCKTFSSDVASLRQVSADIVFSTVSGLRISDSSVRFNEKQEPGVFILDRGEVKFRRIETLYEGSGYLIVKWSKGEKGTLQLFDEVFVEGSDLYVGKVID